MSDYKPVKSSHAISMSIADYLEQADPRAYNGMNRAQTIRAVNDILQGRAERPLAEFLSELRCVGGQSDGEIECIEQDIHAFQTQKALLGQPYVKSSAKEYKFHMYDGYSARPLKIINQQLFDWAAKAGFPPEFFRESYFDHVTIYCMPDGTDCNFSVFRDCTFAVCRIREATFDGTSMYDSEFQSCDLRYVTFFQASIAYTHFRDSTLSDVSFQSACLRNGHTIDCLMERVSFLHATLDGYSFGRVTPTVIRDLSTATITQGGATAEECRRNRAAIFQALGVKDSTDPLRPHKRRGGPER